MDNNVSGNARPDKHDEINAFTAGFRYGADVGIVSPRQADEILRNLGRPTSDASITCFCNGAEDGARGDTFRYLLCLVGPAIGKDGE